jgi:N-acetylglutamate synthase-like GNAT family acetyltransferase
VLRPPKPGDYGWIVAAHGDLYAREYGWNHEIEMLAAEIVADFIKHFDPEQDQCWIAESDGSPVGCVAVVKDSKTTAKLRLLLVMPRQEDWESVLALLTSASALPNKRGTRS